MQINQVRFATVVETARAKAANSPRWIAAIEKAVAGLQGGWIVTELHDGILVTTENGTYHANGVCQCRAFDHGQPCKHRALARLVEMYNDLPENSPEGSRESLIASIRTAWSQKFPGLNLADELMARFRRNKLEMLSVDFLQAIAAIL